MSFGSQVCDRKFLHEVSAYCEVYIMNNYSEYYKKISNATNHKLVENIKELSNNIQNIIELGCGSGRDTVYLLKERV